MKQDIPDATAERIAIIGMGCLFPNAADLAGFWRAIRRGEDGITDVPPTHWRIADYFDADPKSPDRTYCARGGFLSPVQFDPTEFGIPPNILEATDTSQLLSLIAAKAALEDAGYGEDRDFNRERVSVLLGITGTQELVIPLAARLGHPLWRRALAEAGVAPDVAERVVQRISEGYVGWQENSFPGLLGNVVAGRIANRLNLRGTNCVVDAACASSLAAVHLATLELAAGRCDMALAGGADTLNDIFMYMCFSKTPALSPTGDARPFADDADGTVLGEGIGILVLKRLADAQRDGDRLYAVIRGIGASSDGRAQSIYAPHAGGQARALRNAYRQADVEPDTIELIEAHGTGTSVGDATEFEALRTVFREAASDGTWCALGSVKSQIGHTKAAAGAAGLIKAALAIHHRTIPPTIKIQRPNSKINIEAGPFYLSTEPRPWLPRDGRPRRAGVSSFGFGGSNFHVVLEEHRATLPGPAWDGSVQIVALSADSPADLGEKLDRWRRLAEGASVDDPRLAYEAALSRRAFNGGDEHRLVLVMERGTDLASLVDRAAKRLREEPDSAWTLTDAFHGRGPMADKLAVLFPGQGSQYLGMIRDLACSFPEFQSVLAEADRGVEETQPRVSDVVYPPPTFCPETRERQEALLTRTDWAQPALGATCLGAWRVLGEFGVRAEVTAGHSFGELVALCAAGRFDEPALHRLARLRGRVMAGGDADRGTMLAVKAPAKTVEAMSRERALQVTIANRNSPSQCVLSGPRNAIAEAVRACHDRGIACRPLNVGGAFHSALMADAVAPMRQALEAIEFSAGPVPVFANTTGRPYPDDPAAARLLLAEQLLRPVDFAGQIANMHDAGARTFIEVGPKAVLTGLVGAILRDRPHAAFALDASAGQRDGLADLARLLARLAALGHACELSRWERPPKEPRQPRMVIPLVGANYRAATPSAANLTAPPSSSVSKSLAPDESAPSLTPHASSLSIGRDLKEIASPELTLPSPRETKDTHDSDPSLGRLREGLSAMQALQEQTAAAHQRFLEGQEKAHELIRQLLRGQVDRPKHTEPASEFPEPDAPARPLPTGSASAAMPAAEGGRASLGETADAATNVILDVVCEKTGYPREMIDLAMDIEADLGIDSIKRVEILSAVEERLPGFAAVRPEDMGRLRTLAEIVALVPARPRRHSASADPAAPASEFPEPDAPARPLPAGSASAAMPAAEGGRASLGETADAATNVILDVVCEKTGYPREMIDLAMDIEADLGIDSIKRVEILSAVEERLPGFAAVRPEDMGRLRTLAEIVEACDPPSGTPSISRDPRGSAWSAPRIQSAGAGFTSAAESPSARSVGCAPTSGPTPSMATIRRRLLRTVALPSTPSGRLTIAEGHEIWIAGDADGVGGSLAARLREAGANSRIVRLDALPPSYDRIAGLILVAEPRRPDSPVWRSADESFAAAAFDLAQRVGSSLLRAADNGGAFFTTVSRMDGRFGATGGPFDPVSGSLAGLLKTASHEWLAVRCKAIDLDPAWSDVKRAAEAVLREIAADGPLEVGLTRDGRVGLSLVDAPAVDGPPLIAPGDLMVITGGARGITAATAMALAEAYRPVLCLVGRSSVPSAEPSWLAGLTDAAAMKSAILMHEFAGTARPSPARLEGAYREHQAAREIRATLERLGSIGVHAEYRSVDVRDAGAVQSLVMDLTRAHGPVRGLVHAAGVLEDRLIVDKTTEQFDRVFGTKVAGLRNLMEAVSLEDLRLLALFSSVSARFGNHGQADYAMANEALNKAAQRLARVLSGCRVVSLNWGPWAGGMVKPALADQFTRRGVQLIGLEAGARAMVRELRGEPGEDVEIVLGDGFDSPITPGPPDEQRVEVIATPGDAVATVLDHTLTVASHPFLASHVLGGRPVLPIAMMIEWMSHAALHDHPDLLLQGLDDLRVFRPIALDRDRLNLRLKVGAALGDDPAVVIELAGATAGEGETVHARATVRLGRSLDLPPTEAAPRATDERPYERGVEGAYRDVLFHGAYLQGIEQIIAISARGISARLRSAPPPREWMLEPLRSAWLTDPLLLDAALQLPILWCHEELSSLCLPMSVGGYRQFVRALPASGVVARCAARRPGAREIVADISLLDAQSAIVAILRDCRFTVDASLERAFHDAREPAAAS